MGRPLFTLEDDLVDSMCFGFSDKDTKAFFRDALEDGRLAMQESVRAKLRTNPHYKDLADEIEVRLEGQDYVVYLPDDVEDDLLTLEYGMGDQRATPLVRPAVQESRLAVQKALSDGLALK